MIHGVGSAGAAYGMPYFPVGVIRPRVVPGLRVRGMGDTTTLTNPFGLPYPDQSSIPEVPAPSSVPSWLPIVQTGFNDAFSILRLFNPVPPGTTVQTGPGGSFISRAQPGVPTAQILPGLPGTFGSFGAGTLVVLALGIGALLLIGRNR